MAGISNCPQPVVPIEDLFTALDGQDLTVSGDPCRIEVYSVAEAHSYRWIQLAVSGGSRFMVTLKLSAAATVGQVLATLSNWVPNPSTVGELLTVS